MTAESDVLARGGPTFVVGVDGTELSLEALRRAMGFGHAVDARIVVVYSRFFQAAVSDPIAGVSAALVLEEAVDEQAEEVKRNAEGLLGGSGLAWEYVVRQGEPAHEIIDVAHEVSADWVIVGASIHGPISGFFLSSVASHLLHHCDVSVAIVRPPRSRASSA